MFIFQYGISGPYWYAGGATIQIILFSVLSIMLKTRAPGAKTFLQVLYIVCVYICKYIYIFQVYIFHMGSHTHSLVKFRLLKHVLESVHTLSSVSSRSSPISLS